MDGKVSGNYSRFEMCIRENRPDSRSDHCLCVVDAEILEGFCSVSHDVQALQYVFEYVCQRVKREQIRKFKTDWTKSINRVEVNTRRSKTSSNTSRRVSKVPAFAKSMALVFINY